MANHNVLNAQVGQHVSADLAGKSAGFFKVNVLSANMDVGALGFGNGGHQVGERHADHNFAACILNSGDQGVNQLSSLGSGLVHFPVTGNNCLTVLFIHDKNSFLLTTYLLAWIFFVVHHAGYITKRAQRLSRRAPAVF